MSRLLNEVLVGDIWMNPRGRCYEIVRIAGPKECTVIDRTVHLGPRSFSHEEGAVTHLISYANGWSLVRRKG